MPFFSGGLPSAKIVNAPAKKETLPREVAAVVGLGTRASLPALLFAAFSLCVSAPAVERWQ
jgi:hypothetical protein